jgi:mannonate dehydratase
MAMAEQGIRIAVGQFNELTDEKLRFAAQIGVKGVQLNTPKLAGDVRWEEKDLRALVMKAAEYDLTIESIENVPTHFYHKALLGLPGRDEQIENYRTTLRNVGRAGIPILGFHFMPNSVWRTERFAPGRGGAGCTKFDMAEVESKATVAEMRSFLPTSLGRQETMPVFGKGETVVTEEQMFNHYTYFIKAVLPVAEEAGVRMALHPDDPPVPVLGGVARIFREPAGFKRAWELNPTSPAWGLNLCLGCCSEMPGGAANVREMIEFFGPKRRIFYAHFRDVQGTVPNFQECFIGEGNFDPAEVLMLLKKSGFTGFLLDDHVPHMDGDTDWNHRGRAHAIGYMQGLLRMGDLVKVT